jgi:hypothetical protein
MRYEWEWEVPSFKIEWKVNTFHWIAVTLMRSTWIWSEPLVLDGFDAFNFGEELTNSSLDPTMERCL